jgi:aryl sulfotransferase
MVERARLREYVTISETTRRWDGFEHRAGDVVVCTPPKTGTTWTQGIVRSLFSGAVEPSGSIIREAPWIDFRLVAVEDVHARLAAQTQRRCMKTHAPADGIPFWADAFYIAVYRPGRDAFMSWVNHTSNLRFENMGHVLDEALADGVEFPPSPTRDVHVLFDRWIVDPPQLEHFSTFWPLRAEPNVRILHFNDLVADLPGEMRRLADWLGVEIDEVAWPRMVERCTLDEMRAAAATDDNFDDQFRGGATTFFHKGTNGRWKGVLTEDELAAYDAVMNQRLNDAQRAWHENGSLTTGWRPESL